MSKYSNFTAGAPIFPSMPPIGHHHAYKEQIYKCSGHVTRNTHMLVEWSSHCADCGAAFQQVVSSRTTSLNRRCPAHMRAGKRTRKDKLHPASQGWHSAPIKGAKPRNATPVAQTVSGVTAHPRHAEWRAMVLAAPEENRHTLPRFQEWLKQHDDYNSLD